MNKRFFSNYFILLFFLGNSYGQDFVHSSSKTLLDSMRIIQFSNPKMAIELCYQILENELKNKPNQLSAKANNTLGEILQSQGLSNQALEYFVDGLNEYIVLKDSIAIGWIYVNMGNVYFHQNLFDEARKKYDKAIAVFNQMRLYHGQATALNNIALIHLQNNELEEAMTFFHQGLEVRKKINNQALIAHSLLYLGDVHLKQNKHREALQFFNNALRFSMTNDTLNLIGRSHERIGNLYFQSGEERSAMRHFNLAEANYLKNNHVSYLFQSYRKIAAMYTSKPDQSRLTLRYLEKALNVAGENQLLKNQIEILEDFIAFYSRRSDYVNQIRIYSHLDTLRQQLIKSEIQSTLNRSELKLDIANYKQHLELANLENKKALLFRNFLFIIIILLALLFFGMLHRYFYRKRTSALLLQQKEKIHAQELEVEKMKTEQTEKEFKDHLEIKQRELMAKTAFLQQKNDQLLVYKKELDYLTGLLKDKELKKQFHKLQSDMLGNIHKEEEWNDFKKQFVEIYPDFFTKLNQNYQELNQIDLKMCAYLRMNMNTKEIAKLTGMSVRAIENRRYRLRKKLHLDNQTSMARFLSMLAEHE